MDAKELFCDHWHMNTVEDGETGWDHLQKQKKVIYKVQAGKKLTDEDIDLLDGLLNFIDSVQDAAVDIAGINREVVLRKF